MGLFSKPKPDKGRGLGRGVVRRPGEDIDDDGEVMVRDRDVTRDANDVSAVANEPSVVDKLMNDDDHIFPLDEADPTADPFSEGPARSDASSASSSSAASRAVVDEVTGGKEKKRRSLFGRPRPDGEPEEVTSGAKLSKDEKPKKVSRFGLKKSKAADSAKGSKEVVVGQGGVERLSNRVVMDFLPGMAKEDAIATARHFALNHCENKTNAFYTVMAIQDGYAYEVQEGVGKSYLASVIDLATNNPNRLIVVPMLRRKMTIFYNPRVGVFEVSILNEGVDPPDIEGAEPIKAERGAPMKPVTKQYIHWLYTGAIAATVGGIALLGSLVFYALDPQAKVPPEWRVTDVAQLPVMQWGNLAPDGSGSYVVRLEYVDNAWRVVRQDPLAQVQAFSVEDSGTAGVTGGNVVAPTEDGTTVVPPPGATVPVPTQPQPAPVAPGAPPPQ